MSSPDREIGLLKSSPVRSVASISVSSSRSGLVDVPNLIVAKPLRN